MGTTAWSGYTDTEEERRCERYDNDVERETATAVQRGQGECHGLVHFQFSTEDVQEEEHQILDTENKNEEESLEMEESRDSINEKKN